MRLPAIRGIIERRILVNYRVDPERITALLPPPFEPQVVGGQALAGICLIRLKDVRPVGWPRWLGLSSENAAHRIAVQWYDSGEPRRGVFVLRRDTNARLVSLAGGWLFPGVQHLAKFDVSETDSRFEVALASRDGQTLLAVAADLAAEFPGDSVFESLERASDFFAAGSVGYSPGSRPQQFQGMELVCDRWQVEPLAVRSVRSSLFDDLDLFPPGSAQLDNALLMRGITHEWHGREDICCPAATGTRPIAECEE